MILDFEFVSDFDIRVSNFILMEVIMDANFVLKVQDAKAVDIQKALKAAGINVTSIIEVHKEKVEEAAEA